MARCVRPALIAIGCVSIVAGLLPSGRGRPDGAREFFLGCPSSPLVRLGPETVG